METVLKDNARFLELARKYNTNYVLIKGKYEIDIDPVSYTHLIDNALQRVKRKLEKYLEESERDGK